MQKYLWFIILLVLSVHGSLIGQMIVDGDTLYGNEWINYDQTYYKIKVAEDGIYRISGATLAGQGFPVGDVEASQLQLFWMGKEQPIFTSTEGKLGAEDFLEFYGRKNRSELDRFLFKDPDREMLNPEYSLYTDTSVYFLTWSAGTHVRYEDVEMGDIDTSLPVLDWYWHEEKVVFSDRHFKPTLTTQGVRFSTYVEGEGFCSSAQVSQSFKINSTNVNTDGPAAKLSYRISGRLRNHNLTVAMNGQNTATYISSPTQLIIDEKEIQSYDLLSSNQVDVTSQFTNDRLVVGYAKLKYPRKLTFNGDGCVLIQLSDSEEDRLLSIEGLGSSDQYVIYDEENNSRSTVDGSHVRISPSLSNLFISEAKCIASIDIEMYSFNHINDFDANYLFITSKKFLSEAPNYLNDYVEYRKTEVGGNFNVHIICAEDLYDQYAFGVNYHPLSIKNWSNFAVKNWPNLEFVYLIGKGYHYSDIRNDVNKGFLPVYGLPGSDNLLLSKGISSVPNFALGRLATKSQEEIKIYLDKIKVMEDQIANAPQTIEDRLWMKRVLHLSGGSREGNERLVLQNNLATMGERLEQNKFGAIITSLSKQTDDIIDKSINENIVDLINDGVMIKTYFGHGGTTITELDAFEHPKFFNNKDRYPVMISLGCHTGDIFTPVISLSEENIIKKELGGIVYLATSGLGFISSLNIFGNDWYDLIGTNFYTKAISKSIRAVIEKYENSLNIGTKTLFQQLIYHGDPSFKFRILDGPDYVVNKELTNVYSDELTINENRLRIQLTIDNIGQNSEDNINVKLLLEDPFGSIDSVIINELSFNQRLQLDTIIEFNKKFLVGSNKLIIQIDPYNVIEEFPKSQSEENNSHIIPLTILDKRLTPIYPKRYQIVNESNISIIAYILKRLDNKTINIEIDTNETFQSPELIKDIIQSNGGIIKYDFIPKFDNTVYYWRAILEEESSTISSFLYNKELDEGWNQSHIDQYNDNIFNGLSVDKKKIIFDSNYVNLTLNNKIFNPEEMPGLQYNFETIALSVRPWNFLNSGIAFYIVKNNVYNEDNSVGWINGGGDFGSVKTSNLGSYRTFAFNTETHKQRLAAVNFINEIIPVGAYVICFAFIRDVNSDYFPERWEENDSSNIFDALEIQGAKKVRKLKEVGSVPYTLIFEKGVTVLAEDVGSNKLDKLKTSVFLPFTNGTGNMTSPIIGPANYWEKISWHPNLVNVDSTEILIYGIQQNKRVLLDSSNEDEIDISNYDVLKYSQLQLEIENYDIVDYTVPKLDYLRIFYGPQPDLVIDPVICSNFFPDTLQEGESLEGGVGVINLSKTQVGPFHVLYTIINQYSEIDSFTQSINSLETFKVDTFPLNLNHILDPGIYDLNIEVNKDKSIIEDTYTNNTFSKKIIVSRDHRNPIVDIIVDNRHIHYNETVSINPSARIMVQSHNSQIYFDDPLAFEVKILLPDNSEKVLSPDKIHFNSGTVENGNRANLEFIIETPVSGSYQIEFRIKRQSQLHSVAFNINYNINSSFIQINPNPISNSGYLTMQNSSTTTINNYTLNIYSSNGQKLLSLTENDLGILKRGLNKIILPFDKKIPGMVTGLYYLSLDININPLKERLTSKFIYFN